RAYPRGTEPPWWPDRLRDAVSPNLFGVLCAIGFLAIYVFAYTPWRQRNQAWIHIDKLDALLDERPNLFVTAGNGAEFQVFGYAPLPDEVAAQVGSPKVQNAYLGPGNWRSRTTLLRVENRSLDVEAREVMAK